MEPAPDSRYFPSPSAGGQHQPKAHRGLPLLLASMAAIGPFAIDTYLPSFPEISESLGTTPLAVQQTLTAYLAPFAVMTLWHGAISDALGRRGVVLWAFALFACASLGCALSPSIEALWFFRALQGMTAGVGMIVGRAIIRDLFQGPDAHRMMAQVTVMFAVAPAIAPVIGGQLHAWWGWRSVFVFLGMFSCLLWLWCLLQLPETLPREQRQSLHPVYLGSTYWKVLTDPRFLAVSLCVALNFGGFFLYVTSAPAFLLNHLQVKETEFLWLFGPSTLGMMLGAWASNRLAATLTHERLAQKAFLLMGLAALGNLALNRQPGTGLPWAVAPIFLYTLGMTLAMPSLTLLALDLFPSQRGLASSCQGFIQTALNSFVAAVVSPFACFTTLRLASFQTLFLALGFASILVFLGIRRTGRGTVSR